MEANSTMEIPRPWSSAAPRKNFKTSQECQDWIRDEVAQFALGVGIVKYEEHRGRELTAVEHDSVGFISGFTGSLITYAMAIEGVEPLIRRLRRYAVALTGAAVWLVVSAVYFWFVSDKASLKAFVVAFVPSVLAVLLTAAKIWKTWAEAEKTRAEAAKLRKELVG